MVVRPQRRSGAAGKAVHSRVPANLRKSRLAAVVVAVFVGEGRMAKKARNMLDYGFRCVQKQLRFFQRRLQIGFRCKQRLAVIIFQQRMTDDG